MTKMTMKHLRNLVYLKFNQSTGDNWTGLKHHNVTCHYILLLDYFPFKNIRLNTNYPHHAMLMRYLLSSCVCRSITSWHVLSTR